MATFYFTYGSDERFPYQGGWTEVEAPTLKDACDLFRLVHPRRDPSPDWQLLRRLHGGGVPGNRYAA